MTTTPTPSEAPYAELSEADLLCRILRLDDPAVTAPLHAESLLDLLWISVHELRIELAQQSYRHGTGDPEVEATILEIASQGSAAQGLDFQAAEESRRAVERLAETAITGRRA
jgi:hypothetical protein